MSASDRLPLRARPWRRGMSHALAFTLAIVVAGSALAQAAPSREQEQLRRMRQQLQQAQQESQAAQEQARKAQDELKKADEARDAEAKRAGAARTQASTSTRRVTELEAELTTLRTERDGLQTRLSDTSAKLDQTTATLLDTRSQLATRSAALADLEQRHKALTAQYESAVRNNIALHKLGVELLSRYENKGVAESLAAQEPFLKVKRVELENLMQDYRDQLDKERVVPVKAP